jgi:C1A family cysteine protease
MTSAMISNKFRSLDGWKPDRPDHRDLGYAFSLKAIHLPTHVDLRTTGYLPRVEDQGDLGSCTMNSSTSAMEFLLRKAKKPQPELSRLFAYYAERVKIAHGDPADDSGAFLRDCMKCLMKFGTCLETTWPYNTAKFSVNPPRAAWMEALSHRIIKYYKINGIEGLRGCLAEGYPFVFGFSVPESMEGEEAARTGIIKFPGKDEQIIGGHAVLAVGYSDATKMITFQNSWSDGWGDKGFGYLPYRYFTSGLASDFWTIRTEDGI